MNRRLQEQSAEKLSLYLGDERLMKMKEYVQHGDVSTYDHAVLVAFYSCMLACRLRLKYDERALIRGALLHDYYLYDWHEKEAWHKWHGFRHPRFAMENAQRDFHLSEKEIEIIRKHMWSFRAEEKLDRPAAAPQSSICGRCRETSIDIHCKRRVMKMMAAAHWIVIANDRFTGIEMSSEAMETVSIRNRSS